MNKFRRVLRTWQGWLLVLAYIGFLVYSFMSDDRFFTSGSDTLVNWVPGAISATFLFVVLVYIIGEKLGRKSS